MAQETLLFIATLAALMLHFKAIPHTAIPRQ